MHIIIYHYLFFFTWQKANPSIKAIHTCLEFLPTLLRNRAKLNSFFYVIHFRADLQIDIFPIFSFLGALHSFLDQFILYIPSACLFQQQCYCLQTNNALVCNKISNKFSTNSKTRSIYTGNSCTNYALVLKIKSKMGELVQLNGLLFLTAEKTMGCTSNKMALTTISEDEKRLVKDSWNLFVSRGDFSDTGSHMYKV